MRNFEVFISSLGAQGVYAASVLSSPIYPAPRLETAALGQATEPARDKRLIELHRELYSALLSPTEAFASDTRCFADRFYADLEGTSADALIEALLFYFLHRTREDISIIDGLGALRAIFFNHESAEPELWLHSAYVRLAALRDEFPLLRLSVPAPAGQRLQDIAFAACENPHRSPRSTGWIWGELKRAPDGLVRAQVECGLDPSLEDFSALNLARKGIESELSALVGRIFGWLQQEAA
jgi:hypothetical protein